MDNKYHNILGLTEKGLKNKLIEKPTGRPFNSVPEEKLVRILTCFPNPSIQLGAQNICFTNWDIFSGKHISITPYSSPSSDTIVF